ncbi:MAG: YabP/YqfC family sporulation protein [Enterocloster clostridioformis]
MSWEPKKTAVSALGLPRDVILGDVLISFVGRSQVNVENYRSILIYTDTLIKLQARNCRVVIHGARLKIDYYTAEEMKIAGQIGSLEFGNVNQRGGACLIEWLLHLIGKDM